MVEFRSRCKKYLLYTLRYRYIRKNDKLRDLQRVSERSTPTVGRGSQTYSRQNIHH